MATICIFGYYGKQNLGDDLFQFVISKWLCKYNTIFVDPIDISVVPKCDIILVGGGDLVNDYFMTKIRQLLVDKRVPVYAIGIGFPYPQLITADYLSPFDYIVTRTKSVMPILEKIKPGHVMYTDDLVLSLETNVRKSFANKSKSIGVFLASSMCPSTSGPIFDKIVSFLSNIASITYPGFKFTKLYNIYFYCMNTRTGLNENDIILTSAVYNKLEQGDFSNIHLIKTPIEPKGAADLFANFYATICTRYHAHILSICAGVPFLSIYSTFKVDDLLNTIGKGSSSLKDYSQKMTVDPTTLVPTDFNETELTTKFNKLVENYHNVRNIIIEYRNDTDLDSTRQLVKNLVFYKPKIDISSVLTDIAKYLNLSLVSLEHFVITPENAQFVSQVITFAITRSESKSFTWGLEKNLLGGQKIKDAVSWVLFNIPQQIYGFDQNSDIPFEERKYNFGYFNMDILEGVHRSGWQYVVNNLKQYNNPSGVIFDAYLDKTFGWQSKFYERIGILPLKKEWTGIFHHTPEEENVLCNLNNLSSIIQSATFQASLPYCKRLFVLSEYLANWLRKHVTVPVEVLYHPSEPVDNIWSVGQWNANNDKKVIQVGAWMRDVFAIYALETKYTKCALKGKKMDNYFPSNTFLADLSKDFKETKVGETKVCRSTDNKFLDSLYIFIKDKITSVSILDHVSNEKYDHLLSSNVVFLKLINCSASNTVIESILRNTPILVNRLPALEEYLGKDYPLFYDTLGEAYDLLKDERRILAANNYLENMDKEFLSIETFLTRLSSF